MGWEDVRMPSSISQSSRIQGRDGLVSDKGTAPLPAIFMAPTPAPVKKKMPYDQRFPKKRMLALSAVQLAMAIMAIITQVIISGPWRIHIIDTAGLWCGVLFAASGFLGVIASRRPSFGSIFTFMVFATISAAFCFAVLVSGNFYSHGGPRVYNGMCAVLIIQLIVGVIQAAAAIIAAGMTCGAACNCSGSIGESGLVCYIGRGRADTKNVIDQHIAVPEQPPGYITITIGQIQADTVSVGATAFPNIKMIRGNTKTDDADKSPPPKYDSVAKMEEDQEDTNVSQYQRF